MAIYIFENRDIYVIIEKETMNLKEGTWESLEGERNGEIYVIVISKHIFK